MSLIQILRERKIGRKKLKVNSSRLDTEMVHEVQPNSAERESESKGKGVKKS